MSDYFQTREESSSHEIFPGVRIETATGQSMTVSSVYLDAHAVVERHDHPHEQMGILVRGELLFEIGEERRTLKAGDMWKIPGGVPHRVVAGTDGAHAIDVFHPIREEYR